MTGVLVTVLMETREWHGRLERLVPVFGDTFSIDDYERMLKRFYGFYAAFEPSISRSVNLDVALPDWRARRKLPWLKEDLAALGCSGSELESLPVCSNLPPLESLPMWMGALYVVEGSTLGAQLISHHTKKWLPLPPGRGIAFFNGHGTNTALFWKRFIGALAAHANTANEGDIVMGALQTLQALYHWMEQDFGDAGKRRVCEFEFTQTAAQ